MSSEDVGVTLDGHVAVVEMRRPPNNFVDVDLVAAIATALERLDEEPRCRAVVLAAEGKHFCAGGNLKQRLETEARGEKFVPAARHVYKEARRLVQTRKPVIAAVQGAAIGAGLGLAVVADFRVTCREARFAANFTTIGFAPGFGLTYTLPRLVGQQQARMMFMTGRRIPGDEAFAMGLADRLVAQQDLRSEALNLAAELAGSAPLALQSTRATLRRNLVAQLKEAVAHESREQQRHFQTHDFREGVKAMAERRQPQFEGR